jgi:hypothetical protein
MSHLGAVRHVKTIVKIVLRLKDKIDLVDPWAYLFKSGVSLDELQGILVCIVWKLYSYSVVSDKDMHAKVTLTERPKGWLHLNHF